jgi:UDP-4-amino-4-deoxy-L-arabinose formyltransferase/UDP-glucuronic acid dehydrogenase (UDP-4-keto-hexauronic acid decarboxylating)
MRIAILGRTRMLLTTAERLAAEGHRIVGVVACTPSPDYGGTEADFQRLAETQGAPYYFTNSLNAAAAVQFLMAARPDIGVSAGWPSRVGAPTRDLFPFGVLNIHGGDLPKYRGNAPFAWAILNEEPRVGITVHLMDDGLDSGAVIAKAYVAVTDSTYIGDLYAALEREAPALFVKAVNGIKDGSLVPCPQEGRVLYGYARRPEDGRLRWSRAATDLHRLVRASSEPLAGAFAQFNGERLTIWRARVQRESFTDIDPLPTRLAVPGQVVGIDAGAVLIHCGAGTLVLDTVQLDGGERQSAASVIHSLRDRLHDG